MTLNSNTLDSLFTIYVDSMGTAMPMEATRFDALRAEENAHLSSFSALGAGYIDGMQLSSVEG